MWNVFSFDTKPHISRHPFNGGRCLSVCRQNWVSANTDPPLLTTLPTLIHHKSRLDSHNFISANSPHSEKAGRLLRCFCICSFRCICFLYFGAFISPRRQKQIMRWALYQTLKKIHLKCIPVVCNNQISFLKLEKPLWRQLQDSFCQASHVLKLRSQIHQK